MKYRVNVNETSYGSIVVDADSEDDARDKAYDEYYKGNVRWNKSDAEIFGIANDEPAIVD